MVQARIPASTTPATTDSRTPFRPSKSASRMITVSDSELEENMGMLPATDAPYPMIPMRMATNMEMTTQTDAMRRDVFSLSSWLMAMNRRRIWGIPKYPSPHARVDNMVIKP